MGSDFATDARVVAAGHPAGSVAITIRGPERRWTPRDSSELARERESIPLGAPAVHADILYGRRLGPQGGRRLIPGKAEARQRMELR